MSNRLQDCLNFVIWCEGGDKITDDPDDPGGLTRYGISQRAHPDLDIRGLTLDEATEVYRSDYWIPAGCDTWEDPVALMVFDAAVNQGVHRAITMLQEAVHTPADGIIGPMTRESVRLSDPLRTSTRMAARRMAHYGGLPTFSKYGLGWSRRLMNCHELAIRWALT